MSILAYFMHCNLIFNLDFRSQRDVIETAFDSIDSRLQTDQYPSTEEEWRRFVDLGILIEKAVEILRYYFCLYQGCCIKQIWHYIYAHKN